jgi:hypothetical protein
MTRTNLYVIIAALIVVYGMTLGAAFVMPDGLASIKEIALLVLGGLLAIMRPPSQQVGA